METIEHNQLIRRCTQEDRTSVLKLMLEKGVSISNNMIVNYDMHITNDNIIVGYFVDQSLRSLVSIKSFDGYYIIYYMASNADKDSIPSLVKIMDYCTEHYMAEGKIINHVYIVFPKKWVRTYSKLWLGKTKYNKFYKWDDVANIDANTYNTQTDPIVISAIGDFKISYDAIVRRYTLE